MSIGSTTRPKNKGKIRKRSKKYHIERYYKRYRRIAARSLVGAGIILLIFFVRWVGQKTLFATKYTIHEVRYAPESVAQYDDPRLYEAVTEAFSGRNYFLTKRSHRDEIIKQAQDQYPLISDIRFNQQTGSTIYTTISFYQPTIVFRTPPSRRIAIFQGDLYPLVTGNTLGNDAPLVDLPRYTSGLNSLDGILYKIDEYTLRDRVITIQETLGYENISELIYLPGGEKLFVTYKGKVVYFHLTKDINVQLAKLIDLENYYREFETLRRIDLGSVDDIIAQ